MSGLCRGYKDLNDHDELCRDRLLALLCDRDDLTGEFRRLEGPEGEYKKIVADPPALDALLVARYKVEAANPDGGLGGSPARGNAHEKERNRLLIGPTNPGRSDPAKHVSSIHL